MNTCLKRLLLVIGLALLPALFAPAHPLAAVTAVPLDRLSHYEQSTQSVASSTDRIIVKFKPAANLQGNRAPNAPERLAELSTRAGTALGYVRRAFGETYVLRLNARTAISDVHRIVDRLNTLPDVEYAVPDEIRQHTLDPNDTYYGFPYYYQWDMNGANGVNAPNAWGITSGSSSIVVADIDTGITSHPEFSGRIVPGFDFVSDPYMGNDGNGWDADPSDPGDWGCGSAYSSWHGTHTAGTIAATGNNGIGVAGINWNSKLLPVRVLGKCGGYDDDIVAGMLWAAGFSVDGAPANLYPAKVLNLSLGGPDQCSSPLMQFMQDAINQIVGAGVTIVVAAGNSNYDASNDVPASCSGVITVAATTTGGDRASYSNFGSAVAISAPGGDGANAVVSTWNLGSFGPGAAGYAYMYGTSMATPHVAGIASLLYSINPSLTSAQIRQILVSTARPFPTGSSCHALGCGSGIADAYAAVQSAASTLTLPSLTNTSPHFATAGDAGFTLTVNGDNFLPDSVVQWNGSGKSTFSVTSSQIQASVAAFDIATIGSAQITIVGTHPALGVLATNACTFRVMPSRGPHVYLMPFISMGPNPPSPLPGLC